MTTKVISAVLVLFLFALVRPARAQTFSLEWKVLPGTFKTNDFDSVFRALSASKPETKKGEFETTEQYKERLATNARASAGDLVTFLVPAANTYDADQQQFTVVVPITDYVGSGATRLPTIYIKRVETESGSYIGTNAYGAKVTVTKIDKQDQRIACTSCDYFARGKMGSTTGIVATFPMPVETARRAKDSLAFLYIVRPATPFTDTSHSLVAATFNSPKEILSTTYYLFGEILEIWVIDKMSGAIFVKLKPKDNIDPSLVRPKAISIPKIQISKEATTAMITGSVEVKVVINEKGDVLSATAVSGPPLLRASAEAAAMKAKFAPFGNGQPMHVETTIAYSIY